MYIDIMQFDLQFNGFFKKKPYYLLVITFDYEYFGKDKH